VVGSIDGPSTHIVEQLAAKARLAVVAPVCTDPSLTEANVSWMFRCAPSDRRQAEALVRYLLEQRGFRRLAVVSCDDHDARMAAGTFLRCLRRRQVTALLHLVFLAGQSRFGEHARRLAEARCEATVVFGPPEETAALVRAIRPVAGQIARTIV